jgi:hypothetical protein
MFQGGECLSLGHLLRTWPPAISVKTTLRFSHRSETSVCTYSVPGARVLIPPGYLHPREALAKSKVHGWSSSLISKIWLFNCQEWDKYGSREGTSDFRLQTSDFRLQTSDFRHWFRASASLIANITSTKLDNI